MGNGKGLALAYLTALVSGIAVFANSFGVLTLDATAYTFVKNVLVAAILVAIGLSLGTWREFLSLNKKQVLMLSFVGIVGGGAAFVLFFSGLAITGGAVGSFAYRLLFIFAAVIAVIALKEKFRWKVAAGALAILAGNYLLLGGAAIEFGVGLLLVLGATVLWAIEYAVSKKALENLSPTTVASVRMGLGSLIILGVLAFQGKLGAIGTISAESLMWIVVATGFLALFVTLWYSALKFSSLTSTAAVLTIGGPVSAFLAFVFAGKALTLVEAGGFLLLAAGAIFVVGASQTVSSFEWLRKESLNRLRL